MQDWKLRQEIYHRINPVHSDDLVNFNMEISDNIVGIAVDYFHTKNIGWIWPAKSYVVALCYAKWLSEIYGGSPYDYLNDQELLFGNDPYYTIYDKDKETYDEILKRLGGWEFDSDQGVLPEIRHYFDLEFMLHE